MASGSNIIDTTIMIIAIIILSASFAATNMIGLAHNKLARQCKFERKYVATDTTLCLYRCITQHKFSQKTLTALIFVLFK